MAEFVRVYLKRGGLVYVNLDDVSKVYIERAWDRETEEMSCEYLFEFNQGAVARESITGVEVENVDADDRPATWLVSHAGSAAVAASPGQTVHLSLYQPSKYGSCFRYEKAPLLAWVINPRNPDGPRPVAYGLDVATFMWNSGRSRFAIENENGVLTSPDGQTFASVDDWLAEVKQTFRVKSDDEDRSSGEPIHTEAKLPSKPKGKRSFIPPALASIKDKVVEGKDVPDV